MHAASTAGTPPTSQSCSPTRAWGGRRLDIRSPEAIHKASTVGNRSPKAAAQEDIITNVLVDPDIVRFLKDALNGEKVATSYNSFSIDGFRLGIRPEQPPTILIAAFREGMLRLAGREADGTIINWLAPNDVPKVAEIIRQFGDDKEIVARIFVCPSEDAEVVRRAARYAIAAFLNVPVYAAFHAWLGRSTQFETMWSHWRAGHRQAALAAIPDEVVDELIVHGSPSACRARIKQYHDNGVTTSALAILPLEPAVDLHAATLQLAPPPSPANG